MVYLQADQSQKGAVQPPTRSRARSGEEWRAGLARRFRFSSVIRTESYIISLSSTLYMRSRSIFCLFAPLNAGLWFDSVKPLAGFRSQAAFSVLAYRRGYLSASYATDYRHYRRGPARTIIPPRGDGDRQNIPGVASRFTINKIIERQDAGRCDSHLRVYFSAIMFPSSTRLSARPGPRVNSTIKILTS